MNRSKSGIYSSQSKRVWRFMAWTIQNKVASVLVGVSAILLLVGTLFLVSLNALLTSFHWVEHTNQVLLTLESTLSSLKDVETGQRGYVITGNKKFLEPFLEGQAATNKNMKRLLDLTSDNTSQQLALERLEPLVWKRIGVSEEIIEAYNRGGFTAARQLIQTEKGRFFMGEIREVIAGMTDEEHHLLTQRKDELNQRISLTVAILFLMALLMLALLLFVYRLVNQDIRNRMHVQDELTRLKEQAEAASRMKSEFLANMSHEIRTPMNGILGMTEIALNTSLTAEQRKYLEMVQASGQSLMTVINDILDFSKIEAGRMELDNSTFQLRATLASTLHMFSQKAAEKRLELLYHVKADVPDTFSGDVNRLRQIITNLVGNAIKFTERGEVYLDVTCEPSPKADSSVQLHFKVTDTGIGMTMEQQMRIFEPFAQADGSTTRRFGGTGLGLSITSQLVSMMDGRIWVESEPTRGSTFHFTIVLNQASGVEPKPVPVDLEALADMRVLVIDDNATNREILKEFLQGWNMRPVLADSGLKGLDALRHATTSGDPFELILLDAGMPHMDGFTVARYCKQEPELAKIKTIVLTSYGQSGDLAHCRELGLEGYLIKPVGQEALLQAIRGVFGQFPSQTAQESLQPSTNKAVISSDGSELSILLAEDNLINQAVANNILRQLGHTVTIANNGREALERLAEQDFDLLLMDVQMPEMDGLEATRIIRQRETETGQHLPIIALTASAIKGDRERCLEAGMDRYISKPFQRQELVDGIEALRGKGHLPKLESVSASSSDSLSWLDTQQVMARLGDDQALLIEVIQLFEQNSPVQLAAVEAAIREQDAVELEKTAHALKGTVGNFTDVGPMQTAFRLETMGRDRNLQGADKAFEKLEAEVTQLRAALRAWADDALS